jgi:RNA polymerase sigma-70 factor (ECF subfamily)
MATGIEELFRSYWPLVVGYLRRRTGDQALAEELAQETFSRAVTAILGWRGEAPAGWLLAIARNLLRDHARRGHRLVPLEQAPPELDAGPGPGAWLELADLLGRLPASQRRVLELVYLDGFSHAEVAAMSDTTPAAIKTLVWRARASLRALYQDEDEVHR